MKISLSVESETTSTFGFGAHLFAGSRRFHRHRMCFVFQLFFSLSLSLAIRFLLAASFVFIR